MPAEREPVEEEPTIRERLFEASKMSQEPKDRMWAVIGVVSILVLLLGGLVLETRLFLSEGRTLGFQRGAVDCMTVLVDGDRDFDLPDYCSDTRLVIYYPDSVCDSYYSELAMCGAKEDG